MQKFIEAVRHEMRLIRSNWRLAMWAGVFGLWR